MIKLNKDIKRDFFAVRLSFSENENEIGHAYLYIIYNDLHKKPYGLLEDVFIEEKYRGSGLGTKLLIDVIAEAKKNDCYKLIATSRLEREKIHDWYLKQGFKEYGKEFRLDFE
ncbi:MAG: GNAT family N-acetyltransferase [Patescibacteria group bacterium]